MRAVLDPNVIISGVLSAEGSPARVLAAWRAGRFELIVSPQLIEHAWTLDGRHPPIRTICPGLDGLSGFVYGVSGLTCSPGRRPRAPDEIVNETEARTTRPVD